MKKILFTVATHGDEKIGVEIIERLRMKGLDRFFDCLVANPKALRKNTRFIDVDLNRSYPGVKNSKLYEKKLAYENLRKTKKYQYVIDIHEASSGINNFVIAPRKTIGNKKLIDLINLKFVLIWPEPKGPLGEFLKNSVELEFGMKNKKRKNVIDLAQKIIEQFIKNVYSVKSKLSKGKQIFYVYGKLLGNTFPNKKIIDFRQTKIGGERFYPLLTGQYLKEGILCYKMLPLFTRRAKRRRLRRGKGVWGKGIAAAVDAFPRAKRAALPKIRNF